MTSQWLEQHLEENLLTLSASFTVLILVFFESLSVPAPLHRHLLLGAFFEDESPPSSRNNDNNDKVALVKPKLTCLSVGNLFLQILQGKGLAASSSRSSC